MDNDKLTNIVIKLIISTVIFIMMFSISFIIFKHSTSENKIYLSESNIVIDYYGFNNSIELEQIIDINLIEKLPEGGKRGAGVEDNKHIAGDANFNGIGYCKAYIIKNSNAFLLITTNNQKFLINDPDSSVTIEIYDFISSKLDLQ